MVVYRFKEREYAEKIISDGFQTRYVIYELKILAKYYKSVGKKPKEIRELITEFCRSNIDGFNEVKYFRKINSVLNYANNKKNKLFQIENVEVMKSELDHITSLKNLDNRHKRVLFCLLVENKISRKLSEIINGEENAYVGSVFGCNRTATYKDLADVSGVGGYAAISKIIKELTDRGFLDVLNRGKIDLKFVEDMDITDEVGIKVSTFENTGLFYDYFIGDDSVIDCEMCGKLIKKKSNNAKYCEICWKIRERELWRKSKRKQREVECPSSEL